MEDKSIPVLTIEEIKKINIYLDASQINMVRDFFNSIDLQFKHKALLLCAYIMNVDPNNIMLKNTGRKVKISPDVFIARYMWFTIISSNYSYSKEELSEVCGFPYMLIHKGIGFFNEKRKKSSVLNAKYNTILEIIKQQGNTLNTASKL